MPVGAPTSSRPTALAWRAARSAELIGQNGGGDYASGQESFIADRMVVGVGTAAHEASKAQASKPMAVSWSRTEGSANNATKRCTGWRDSREVGTRKS